MIKRVFCDANIILDLIDLDRGYLEKARKFVLKALEEDIILATSCDILSNIYYVGRKKLKKEILIRELQNILEIFEVDVIDKEMAKIALDKNSKNLSQDFEDLLQNECALAHCCDMLVTNDKKFVKDDILVVNLDEALEKLYINH